MGNLEGTGFAEGRGTEQTLTAADTNAVLTLLHILSSVFYALSLLFLSYTLQCKFCYHLHFTG